MRYKCPFYFDEQQGTGFEVPKCCLDGINDAACEEGRLSTCHYKSDRRVKAVSAYFRVLIAKEGEDLSRHLP